MGCGLVTAGVTPGKTGFVPCCDLSARGRRPRTGWRSWPDQELDHLALAAPGVSHHSPAEPPSRTGTTSRPAKERTHEQSDRSARGGRCRHRRRHPRPYPLSGRDRCCDWWRPRRDHRGGDSRGLCRAGGVRQQPSDVAGLGDRGDRRSRRRPEPSPARVLGDRHRAGPPEAGRAPQRREVGPARCDPSRARGDGSTSVGNSPQRGRTPSPVSALGRSPLRDQRLHRGPAAGLQPGDRSARTHPRPVPWSEACRDAQHRREPASARVLGHRDDQHRGGAANLGSSRARDVEGGT